MTTPTISSDDMAAILTRADQAASAAADRVIGEAMAAFGLPTLAWVVVHAGRHISGYANAHHGQADVPVVLQQWADALGLTESPESGDGMASYAGSLGRVRVEMWGITDRAAWERAYPGPVVSA